MKLAGLLAVKPLLYLCGALLALCGALGIALALQAARMETLSANLDAAGMATQATATERDAHKQRVQELTDANDAYGVALSQVRNELSRAQIERTRLALAATQALDRAQSDAEKSAADLAAFRARYTAHMKKPECPAALQAMEAACASLSDY